jgi:hypothetical protein
VPAGNLSDPIARLGTGLGIGVLGAGRRISHQALPPNALTSKLAVTSDAETSSPNARLPPLPKSPALNWEPWDLRLGRFSLNACSGERHSKKRLCGSRVATVAPLKMLPLSNSAGISHNRVKSAWLVAVCHRAAKRVAAGRGNSRTASRPLLNRCRRTQTVLRRAF